MSNLNSENNLFISDALFSKDKNGKIRFWKLTVANGGFNSNTGNLHPNGTHTNFKSKFVLVTGNTLRSLPAQIAFEMKARYKHKINSGFNYLDSFELEYNKELGLFIDVKNIKYSSIYTYLLDKLPEYKSDSKGSFKPMLCKTFKENKCVYPMYAQPKINGLRGCLSWEEYTEGEGMFITEYEGAVFKSREGKVYVLPHLSKLFTKDMFDFEGEDISYDGELYIHNTSLNIIKASCPMVLDNGTLSKPSGDPTKIQFWCFDIVAPIQQKDRLEILDIKLKQYNVDTVDIGNVRIQDIVKVPTIIVNTDYEFKAFADWCIDNGFEGTVGRNMTALYMFGYRGIDMVKLKQAKHTECIILDIIPKPKEPTTGLFVLRNDINDETFECNPMGTYKERVEYLTNVNYYIGKKATVKFYERSGVKKCPFHANVETIRNYE